MRVRYTGDMYPTRQVADMLGVSRTTLYRWRREGRIRAVNINDWCVMYEKAAIDEFLARNEKYARIARQAA